MDPEIAYREIRRLLEKYAFSGGDDMTPDDAALFFESVEGLDSWLRKGGSLPMAWNR